MWTAFYFCSLHTITCSPQKFTLVSSPHIVDPPYMFAFPTYWNHSRAISSHCLPQEATAQADTGLRVFSEILQHLSVTPTLIGNLILPSNGCFMKFSCSIITLNHENDKSDPSVEFANTFIYIQHSNTRELYKVASHFWSSEKGPAHERW